MQIQEFIMKYFSLIAVAITLFSSVNLFAKTPEAVVKKFWKNYSLLKTDALKYTTKDCVYLDGKKKFDNNFIRTGIQLQNDIMDAALKNDVDKAISAHIKSIELSGYKIKKSLKDLSPEEKQKFMTQMKKIAQDFPNKFVIKKIKNLHILSVKHSGETVTVHTDCSWEYVKAGKRDFVLIKNKGSYLIKELRIIKEK